MRSVMGIAAVAVIAGGGIYFVTNGGHSSHCGPCVSGTGSLTQSVVSEPASDDNPTTACTPVVLDLVNVADEPPACPTPKPERWVSFDEPPRVMPVKYEQPAMPVPDRIPHILDEAAF